MRRVPALMTRVSLALLVTACSSWNSASEGTGGGSDTGGALGNQSGGSSGTSTGRPLLGQPLDTAYYMFVNQVPCAVIAAWFGVMPNPGPFGMGTYPFCINGFGTPSIRESYHDTSA